MNKPKLKKTVSWFPHAKAAPKIKKDNQGQFKIGSNSTRTCSGGIQFHYQGFTPLQAYRFVVKVSFEELEHPRDSLLCLLYWGNIAPNDCADNNKLYWDYLLPRKINDHTIQFERTVTAPKDANLLTLRYIFRWSATGKTKWSAPEIHLATSLNVKPVRICIVTGSAYCHGANLGTLKKNTAFYERLCVEACKVKPHLIVLPEIALQWRVPGHPLDLALPVPGKETDVFSGLAKKYMTRIMLGVNERENDTVYNSAVLIGPNGKIDGKYHKVHLATNEGFSGIMPGNGFPVFETEIGRIGCNICMDSSASESARMVALNGADFLLLPIMGDERCDRFSPGDPIFSESRWKAVQRAKAIDNQICLVIARNNTIGSCIIDRKGEILAWNEGERDFIWAEVNLNDGYRSWDGGCLRDINWMQRRPHLYGSFMEEWNTGSSREKQYPYP